MALATTQGIFVSGIWEGGEGKPTFEDVGEGFGLAVIRNTGKFELGIWMTLAEEILHPTGFGGVTDGSPDVVASFKELVNNMAGDVAVDAGDEDDGSLWEDGAAESHCACLVPYRGELLFGKEAFGGHL